MQPFACMQNFLTNAEAAIQLRKTLFEGNNVLGVGRLQLPLVVLIDVRDLAGLDRFEQPYEPVSLLMPIFSAHDRLNLP